MTAFSATGEARRPALEAGTMIRRWFDEVWNQGNEQAIDPLLAEDATMWGVTRPDVSSVGSEQFKKFHRTMRSAFSDLEITVHQVVQEGDTAFARWTVTGTHAGEELANTAHS
jgi:predicted ester cyclase